MKRPRRQRKHDRITWGSASREEIAIDHAIAPFDRKAREMDALWGVDRLPTLVSPETAARYGRTLGSLNAAIDKCDLAAATDRAAACIRGMMAMDAEARDAGHVPPSSGVIEGEANGFRFGILPDPTMWRQAESEFPGLRILTLREVGLILQQFENRDPVTAAMKDTFPGVEITSIKPRSTGKLPDDEIPF